MSFLYCGDCLNLASFNDFSFRGKQKCMESTFFLFQEFLMDDSGHATQQ